MTEPTRTFGRRRGIPAVDDAEQTPETANAPRANTGGWGTMEKVAAQSSSDFFLKVGTDPVILKILNSDPFDNYCSHWVEEITEGSKSVRCWGTSECPLCRIGDRPKKFSACFNVASLEDPQNPSLRVWETGVKIARQLKDIALDSKKGPLNRDDLYFTVHKVQKAKSVEYVLERIRARDLEEETGIAPLSADVLRNIATDCHTEPVKDELDEADMAAIVKLLLDGS